MKRLALAIATALALAIACSAQSASFMVADVPFSFHVRNSHASAGTYRISYQGWKEYLAITDGQRAAMIVGLTYPAPQAGQNSPKLVFHKYGDEYFLVAIQMPGQEVWKIPFGKRALITHRIVLTKAQPEEITLMARLSK